MSLRLRVQKRVQRVQKRVQQKTIFVENDLGQILIVGLPKAESRDF